MSISVSIVEDAAGVREGLVRLLQSASGFACLASYPDAETALAEIPRQPPDVVLMDIDLPGMNGVECVRRLKALLPALRVVMLTVYDNPEKIFDALSAGAIGYLLKKRLTEDLLDSVRDAHTGGAPMSSQIARKVVQFFQQLPPANDMESLSARELEVARLVAEGFSSKEVAARLDLSVRTVEKHRANIMDKIGVREVASLVRWCVQCGIVKG